MSYDTHSGYGSGYNVNNLNVTGFYSVLDGTNAPKTGWVNYIITRFDNNVGFIAQIAICLDDASTWRRVYTGNSWTNWASM